MSKKDWKKQIMRMKQIADQNLGRSEKSEVLTDDLQLLERQMNQIKDALQIIVKKLQACLIPYSGEADKRLRKLPEYALSSCFGDLAVTFNNETVFGKLFGLCSEAEMFVAKKLVNYTIDIEAKVIQPAQVLLERDIPAILKLRKQLANMTLDMDSAKSRHQALCKQTQNTTSSVRLDAAREEFEEAEAKVEHCKDVFATEMYSFFAREEELCKMLLSLLESQSAYHQQSIDALDRLIPLMRDEIELNAARPVFGCSLEEHLRHSKREIASVIEDCVAEIIKRGLDVEGLFRIAPAASKVKELKAAFDANMVDVDEFDDIHCFCASLKHYLRELPQPIMTFELYNEWLQACQRPPDERLNALWVVVDKLPKFNYTNLRYVIKFLAKVAEQSDVNKMNASNLGIVIGPNLLWPPGENRSNVRHASSLALIVEALIGSSEWFFPGDVDFPSADGSALNASISSSSDVSLQKSQAKFAFLVGNQSNSASTALKTSSSDGCLLEHNSALESKLTESVSYNVCKPPKRVKVAAPAASPAHPGSQHPRSASISLLASNVSSTMKETTAVGAVKQDDTAMDRKAATSARPRFPPPARPAQPQLDKTSVLLQPLFPNKPTNSVTRLDQTDGALVHSQSSSSCDRISEGGTLEIDENISRKLVSRSLDDFVSETRHCEKYRPAHGDSCFESEKASDTEEGFNQHHHHHHQASSTSSYSALGSASGFSSSTVDSQTRGKLCPDERAAAEEVLPGFKPSVPVSSREFDGMESDARKMSITSVSSVRSADGITSDLPSGASSSFIQGVPHHRKDFADKDSKDHLQYIKAVCVSVEPPTPESSNHQNKALRVDPEPSFIDKGNNATSAVKNRSEAGQFTVSEDSHQRSFQSLSADNASNFARTRIENQLETNSASNTLTHSSGVTVIRNQCSKEVTSDKDTLVDRGTVRVESKSGLSPGDYEERSKTESSRSERSTVPFEARQQVNVASQRGVTYAAGTTERCNVQVMTHKDCDEIVNVKSDNLNTAGVAVQLENNLGKQDESYKDTNENQPKQGDCSNRQQDIHESDSAKFSSTSSATSSGVSANCNTVISNASSSNLVGCGTEGPSNTGYGPTGAVVSSQAAKQSDHKEMIQSLKLFFLSDKSPEMSPRGRSNSDVDRFRPGPGSELSRQSTESTRPEGSLTSRGSAGTLATGSQSECRRQSSSSTQASAARFSSSSTDVSSSRACANASPREKFFASADPSAPVFYPSHLLEARGTEGTARSERSGVPPPSPARRNHPSDSGNENATARRSKEGSSDIVEDTRL